MTPADVENKLADLVREARRGGRWDNEVAHAMEDALRADVLAAIADGICTDPAECARLALSTDDLDFCRWFA